MMIVFRIDGYFETRYFDKNVTDDKKNTTILKQVQILFKILIDFDKYSCLFQNKF